MKISFLRENFLLILPFILVTIILITFKFKEKRKKFKKIFTILRCINISIMIFALAGLQIQTFAKKSETMFLLDISESMIGNQRGIEFINNALKYCNQNSGLSTFSKNTSIEKIPEKNFDNFNINQIQNKIDTSSTNISNGLETANSIMNNDYIKRIVLISDGLENSNNSIKTAKELAKNGTIIDSVYIKNEIEEVQLNKINIKNQISKGTKFDIEVNIYSSNQNKATLSLFKNETLFSENQVNLNKGENKIIIPDIADTYGLVKYKAEINTEKDTYKQNNVIYGYTYIKDKAKILLIENLVENKKSGDKIFSVINNNLDVTRINAKAVSYDDESLANFDCVIIADCPYNNFNEKFIQTLENYIKNGGGLFVTGGENSFGLGEYENTKLEEFLPINIAPQSESQDGQSAIIMVIDRSGSMSENKYGVTKLDMAKKSIISAIEYMNVEDQVGVIAFDDTPNEIVELQQIGQNTTNIINKVEKISEGGGTSILPALKVAINKLSNSNAKYKHIILMTDGQAETSGYSESISKMNNNNITLSTVAVGSEADTNLLKNLASASDGRYYYTDEFKDIPRIFINETKALNKKYINEIDFYPNITNNSTILNGINKIPLLNGYIACSLKNGAEQILTTEDKTPLLATIQYGLGKTAVFATDTLNWCENWFATKEGTDIFNNTISKLLKNRDNSEFNVSAIYENGKNIILLENNSNENFTIKNATLIGNNLNQNLEFKLSSTKNFKAEISDINSNIENGFYTISAKLIDNNGNSKNFTGYVFIPYSREYDFSQQENGKDILQQISNLTGGKLIEKPEDVFYQIKPKLKKNINFENILMTISIILFIIEIGLRKFGKKLLLYIHKFTGILFIRNKKEDISKSIFKSSQTNIDNGIKLEEKEELIANELKTTSALISRKKKRNGG